MSRKVYSQSTPPAIAGEVFTKESLTDQLADEPLKDIVERFLASGTPLPSFGNSDVVLTETSKAADVEAAFDDFATADVARMDKVEQMDALVTAQRLVEQLRRDASAKPKNEPGRPQEHPEEKEASTSSADVEDKK